MKRFFFVGIFVWVLTSCSAVKPVQEIDPIQLQTSYEEEFREKFVPEAYHPFHFDSENEELDLDKKRQELIKLKDYNLISNEEFEEKIKAIDNCKKEN